MKTKKQNVDDFYKSLDEVEILKQQPKQMRLLKPKIGMMVFHKDIYNGKEIMKIVGIRETEVELEGDYSGGTHAVTQKDWLLIEGLFRLPYTNINGNKI